jgi:hypothetical protein
VLPGGHDFLKNRRKSSFSRPRLRSLFALIVFPLSVSACPLYNPASFVELQAAKNILLAAKKITLAWDPPVSGTSSVVNYVVSYRIHNTSAWTTLATVPASAQPSFVVSHSAIGGGSFDFAVVAVTSNGATSFVHTSLDAAAVPAGGWFLTW